MPTNRAILALLTVLLGVIILSNSAYAWSWQPYYHAINVTVADWRYADTIGANTYYGAMSNNVLVSLANTIDPFKLNVHGYTITGTDLGEVKYGVFNPYAVFNGISYNSLILISNKTISGAKWDKATIFYDAIGVGTYTFKSTANYSLSNNFVVLTIGDGTISYHADAFNEYNLTISGNAVTLRSLGIIGYNQLNTTLIQNKVLKNSTFGIYNTTLIYFYWDSPQILGSTFRVYENRSKMYNLTSNTATLVSFGYVTPNIPAAWNIYPPFTSNVVVGNVVNNPLPSSLNTSINGWYGLFLNRLLISNLTDNYTFWTYIPPAAVTDNTINRSILHAVTYNGVPYKIVELPYRSTFGTSCTDLYGYSYNVISTLNLGAVPFYVLNCTPTTRLLLLNKTIKGYSYDNFYLYFNMPLKDSSPSFWNNSVYNGWHLTKTANSLIELSTMGISELTLPSSITTDSFGSHISFGSSNTNSILNGQHTNFTINANGKEELIIYDGSGNNSVNTIKTNINAINLKFLVGSVYGQYAGNAANFFLGRDLVSHGIIAGANRMYIGNQTTTANNVRGDYYRMEIRLHTITATLTKLYSSNYTIGITETKSVTNFNNTNPINMSSTSTIDYTHGNLNQTRTIYTGVTLKVWEIYLLAVMCILIMMFTFNPDQPFIFVCGLIFLVILGLLEWALMIIAAMALLFFIMYEYTQKKR